MPVDRRTTRGGSGGERTLARAAARLNEGGGRAIEDTGGGRRARGLVTAIVGGREGVETVGEGGGSAGAVVAVEAEDDSFTDALADGIVEGETEGVGLSSSFFC